MRHQVSQMYVERPDPRWGLAVGAQFFAEDRLVLGQVQQFQLRHRSPFGCLPGARSDPLALGVGPLGLTAFDDDLVVKRTRTFEIDEPCCNRRRRALSAEGFAVQGEPCFHAGASRARRRHGHTV